MWAGGVGSICRNSRRLKNAAVPRIEELLVRDETAAPQDQDAAPQRTEFEVAK